MNVFEMRERAAERKVLSNAARHLRRVAADFAQMAARLETQKNLTQIESRDLYHWQQTCAILKQQARVIEEM